MSMIDAGEPVWFACDVGKDSLISRDGLDTGFMLYNILDRDSLFGVDTKTKQGPKNDNSRIRSYTRYGYCGI